MADRITEEQKALVIEALSQSGNNTIAAQKAGIDRKTITQECKRDKRFAKDVLEARQSYGELLEAIADNRIKDGTDKGSAILLIFRLKSIFPEKYRETQTVKHEGNIKIITGVPRPQGTQIKGITEDKQLDKP